MSQTAGSPAVSLIYVVRNRTVTLNGTVASNLLSRLTAELVGYFLFYPPLITAERKDPSPSILVTTCTFPRPGPVSLRYVRLLSCIVFRYRKLSNTSCWIIFGSLNAVLVFFRRSGGSHQMSHWKQNKITSVWVWGRLRDFWVPGLSDRASVRTYRCFLCATWSLWLLLISLSLRTLLFLAPGLWINLKWHLKQKGYAVIRTGRVRTFGTVE